MATSALERHASANVAPEVVRDLRGRIAEAGVEQIYYAFVSLNGRVMGKLGAARHLERNLERGVQVHGSAVADLATNVHGRLIWAGPEAEEIVALPDPDTFAVLPWDRRFGRFLCRLYRRADVPDGGGDPLPTDPRGRLVAAHAAFRERVGLQLRSGLEPEMSWLGEGLEPVRPPHVSPAYHVGALERMRPIVERVTAYATALGLDMIEGDYEDTHQLELNFAFDDCLRTCDRLLAYRQVCAQVAAELGVTATFMPKPFIGLMANGCHHNLSLWRDDENTFAEDGRRDRHLTDVARHAMAGLLEHARASMAVYASTVNSYTRFWDAGLFAPALANWGFDNRTCAVRVSAIGRLELKLPDASVNPYLSHAVALAAMADGIERRLDPGPPEARDSYDAAVEAETTRFAPLPRSLGEALDAMRDDPLVAAALGPSLRDLFLEYKDDEWGRFLGAVTDWHRDMYLGAIP